MNDYEYQNILELSSLRKFFVVIFLKFIVPPTTLSFGEGWRGVFEMKLINCFIHSSRALDNFQRLFRDIMDFTNRCFPSTWLGFHIHFSGRQVIDLKFKWEPLNRTRTTLRECLFAGASQNAPITPLHLISWRVLQTYKYWHTRLSSKKLILTWNYL